MSPSSHHSKAAAGAGRSKRSSLPFSLSTLLSHFTHRPARSPRRPMLVSVWDAHRNQYRSVDLRNREDPLWQQAKTLAAVQSNGDRSSRSAA